MGDKCLEPCSLSQISSPDPSMEFDYSMCQDKYKLKAEDEISIDSIFSAILSMIEPTEATFKDLKFDVDPKDLLNEKQAILFQEDLYISRLKDTNCKLREEHKIFMEHELEQIGCFCLSVEESFDGFVVFSKSKMHKAQSKSCCGHSLKGKYNDRFILLCEKRTEFDYVDKVRVEKSLETRNKGETLVAIRETKINKDSQKLRAEVNIKGREKDPLIMDGGVLLLIRWKVVNHFVGDFHYYSMNLAGRIVECCFTIHEERKKLKIFKTTYSHAVHVTNTQTFNGEIEETSESYYTAEGKIILHFWHQYNYLLHITKRPTKPIERILPKMELMWRSDLLLLNKYKKEKKLNYDTAMKYLKETPELGDFLYDYIISLLRYKPDNVLEYTVRYFQNMKEHF